MTTAAFILVLAATRLVSDQIRTDLPGGTRITVEQAARVENQLAGNVRVIRILVTILETGEVREIPVVLIYPPEEWCTAVEPRICP